MRKLIAMSFLALGTLSMYADGNVETPSNDQINVSFKCYKFEVSRRLFTNHNPSRYETNYVEYGFYTEAGAKQRADEFYDLYPTDIDHNGNGFISLHGYHVTDGSACFSVVNPT